MFPRNQYRYPSIPKSHLERSSFQTPFPQKISLSIRRGEPLWYIFISIFSRIFRVFSACITGRGGKKEHIRRGDSVLIFITGSFAWWMRHNVFLGCSGNKVSHAFVPRSASSPWQAGGIMIGNARGPRVRPPTRYPTSFLPLLPFILSALSRGREREREASFFPFPSSVPLLPLRSSPPVSLPRFLSNNHPPCTLLSVCFSVSSIFAFARFVVVQWEFAVLSKIFGFFRRCTSCFACFLIGERYGKICCFDDWLILDGAIFFKKGRYF